MLKAINYPSNANYMNSAIISVTTFDIFDTHEYIDLEIFVDPIMEAFNSSFEAFGFGSLLVWVNGSVLNWVFIFNLFLLLILGIVVFVNKRTGRLQWTRNKLQGHLIMNPLIVLFLEAFLEISIFATLNLYTWDWNTDFESVMVSHIMAIFYAVFLTCGSFFLLTLYMRNIKIWNDEDAFVGKYDAAISNANVDMLRQQGMVMAIPVMFFARRIVLTITVIFMQEFLTGHLGL